MVVSHHVGAGNQTQILCKSSECSQQSCISCPLKVVWSIHENRRTLDEEGGLSFSRNRSLSGLQWQAYTWSPFDRGRKQSPGKNIFFPRRSPVPLAVLEARDFLHSLLVQSDSSTWTQLKTQEQGDLQSLASPSSWPVGLSFDTEA